VALSFRYEGVGVVRRNAVWKAPRGWKVVERCRPSR